MKKILILINACALLALASCANNAESKRHDQEQAAATTAQAQRDAVEAARETVWGTIQINSQPQGAAIEMGTSSGWQSLGYAPVTANVVRHKDDGTLANFYMFRGIPTGEGQFQQIITIVPNSNSNVIFYMYNNGQ
jgi:ABC-type enterochelin transport system substrate-binding protein